MRYYQVTGRENLYTELNEQEWGARIQSTWRVKKYSEKYLKQQQKDHTHGVIMFVVCCIVLAGIYFVNQFMYP